MWRVTHSLIPVLVTGSQPREVFRVKRLFRTADAALLDPCDKHRDEGGNGSVRLQTTGIGDREVILGS